MRSLLLLALLGTPDPAPPLPVFCRSTTATEIAAMRSMPLSCGFDRATMRYAGTPVEQGRCLLRRVEVGGTLGAIVRLPVPLERLIGRRVKVRPAALTRYLATVSIAPAAIGGTLDQPLARTVNGRQAAYFVIHDTSTPYLGAAPFPADIDDASWPGNDLTQWAGPDAVAHLFIARTGASLTGHDYGVPWRATKAESCVLGMSARGLFLHNELVQPRRGDPAGPPGNDRLAPPDAFTPAQLDRLAVAYAAASVRAGRWLVPAFHATIDAGLGDAHDDPQGFPLADWAIRVAALAATIR